MNSRAIINFRVSGNPFPQAVVKNAHSTYPSFYLYQNLNSYVNQYEKIINITKISKQDHGELICSVSNSFGNITSNTSLFVTVVCMIFLNTNKKN